MSFLRVFLISMAVGAGSVLAFAALQPAPPERPSRASVTHTLIEGVGVRSQIGTADIARLRDLGYRTIVDLRPDGEVAGQPSSQEVGTAARDGGMSFAYVPTPHGTIPDAVVADLSRVLATAERPVMLYCRSGKRAARVWALAEAARSGGADAGTIATAVKAAGQPVDDIMARIVERVAQRRPAS